jgi:hypothetical protein
LKDIFPLNKKRALKNYYTLSDFWTFSEILKKPLDNHFCIFEGFRVEIWNERNFKSHFD